MTLDEIKAVIETRLKAEKGNFTEYSLMWEINQLLTELQERRNREDIEHKTIGEIQEIVCDSIQTGDCLRHCNHFPCTVCASIAERLAERSRK